MDFPTDSAPETHLRARLTDQLRERLESAHELAAASREWLKRGDAGEIEAGTARLRSTAEEFKLLVAEFERLPALPADEARDSRLVRAHAELAATVSRLARSSAVSGGLLERLITVARGRLNLLTASKDGTYRPSGESSQPEPRGVRLKEWV